ncbi:unnamed protein product [Toxocara canis]|uniref:KH domain-containing protein n=1 Tax=Toxocara canis TaxID=6265 RepID=A0A183V0D7_TOXCA|nr:unnamed protein product [Toxocara canis]
MNSTDAMAAMRRSFRIDSTGTYFLNFLTGAAAGVPCGLRLSLSTYNCRSLSGADRLNYLMEEKKKICCDVLGISQTCRAASLTAQYKDGNNETVDLLKSLEEEHNVKFRYEENSVAVDAVRERQFDIVCQQLYRAWRLKDFVWSCKVAENVEACDYRIFFDLSPQAEDVIKASGPELLRENGLTDFMIDRKGILCAYVKGDSVQRICNMFMSVLQRYSSNGDFGNKGPHLLTLWFPEELGDEAIKNAEIKHIERVTRTIIRIRLADKLQNNFIPVEILARNFVVASADVSRLTGADGITKNWIETDTGCSIMVRKELDNDKGCTVELRGESVADCEMARMHIENIMERKLVLANLSNPSTPRKISSSPLKPSMACSVDSLNRRNPKLFDCKGKNSEHATGKNKGRWKPVKSLPLIPASKPCFFKGVKHE